MEAILDNFTQPSSIVLIAVGLIVLYSVLTFVLMSFILINRTYLRYRERRDQRLVERHENEIFEILIGEQKRNDPRAYRYAVDRLRVAFSGSAIYALKEILFLLGRDFSGENADLLCELYQDLRLDQRAIQVLNEGRWYQKIGAIKELGHFHVTHASARLRDFTEDSHPILRDEAQCTLLRLGGASQLNFLATLDQPITQWQQIRINQVLKRSEQDELPEFHTYLANPNEQVLLFVLKLIRIYNQTQARDTVIDMLFDLSPTVQREAIRTVSGWLDREIVALLMTIYSEEEESMLHVSVVQALRQWSYDHNTRTFLENVAATTDDYTLRMNALRSLRLLGGNEAIIPLADTLDKAGQRCVNHQLDDLI